MWKYSDGSKVYFENNKVIGWEDHGMLKIKDK